MSEMSLAGVDCPYDTPMQTADRFIDITHEILHPDNPQQTILDNYLCKITRWQMYIWAEQLMYNDHVTETNFRNIEHHLHKDYTQSIHCCMRFFIFPTMKKSLKRQLVAIIKEINEADPTIMKRPLPTMVQYEPMEGTKYY